MDCFSFAALNHNAFTEPAHRHVLPLTKENLSLIEEDTEPTLSIMSRYYNSLSPPPPFSARRERRVSSTYSVDTVIAPSRIMSFPYHNNSFFLPMAEHLNSPRCSSVTPAPSLDSLTLSGSCRPPTPAPSCSGTPTFGRRSSATLERRPSPLGTFPPRRFNSAPPFEKMRRHLNTHLQSDSSSDASQTVAAPEPEPTKLKKKFSTRWLKGFVKLFKKPKSNTAKSTCRMTENSPVWYSQYTANPPPPAGFAVTSSA